MDARPIAGEPDGHIVRGYDGDLMHLRLQVLELGGYAIEQVCRAVEALVEGRDSLARAVLARHEFVLARHAAIEDYVVALLARRAPVASDLRTILAIARIATDLERVGNAARKITRITLDLRRDAPEARLGPFYRDVKRIAGHATAMLRDALDCFDRGDLAGAEGVVERDAEIDAEFRLALRDLVTHVMEDPRHLPVTIHTVFVIKSLERVGDHARNVAAALPKLQRR